MFSARIILIKNMKISIISCIKHKYKYFFRITKTKIDLHLKTLPMRNLCIQFINNILQ